MRDKQNGKKKIIEEKSLFFDFPRFTLTEIIATHHYHVTTRQLLRVYMSKRVTRLKRERKIEDNYSILRSIIRICVLLFDSGNQLSNVLS